jgi:hypothetical protein
MKTEYLLKSLLNDFRIVENFSKHKDVEQHIAIKSKIELLEWILEI